MSFARFPVAVLPAGILIVFLAAAADKFVPGCPKPRYPTPAPAQSLSIDTQCGLGGSGKAGTPEAEQNKAKNNFCAQGNGKSMKLAAFAALQKSVDADASINYGNPRSPVGDRKVGPTDERAALHKLGEGGVVTFQGFVLIARQEGPESVNCELPVQPKAAKGAGNKTKPKSKPEDAVLHDIHISLVENKNTLRAQECTSVVAEMSPHHRPDSWNHANVEKVAILSADAKSEAPRNPLPVRVTGQLFFDSSHYPCSGGKPVPGGNPSRASLWEIHPIYQFEVCPSGTCDATGWQPLSEWAGR